MANFIVHEMRTFDEKSNEHWRVLFYNAECWADGGLEPIFSIRSLDGIAGYLTIVKYIKNNDFMGILPFAAGLLWQVLFHQVEFGLRGNQLTVQSPWHLYKGTN